MVPISSWWWGGRRTAAVGAVVAALALASCGADADTTGSDGAGPPSSGGDLPLVVASTSIWADVVRNVACGDLVRVESLIPVGADSHGFEPSLADRGRLDAAALVVVNGLGLEEGLAGTIEAAEADGARVVRIADHVEVHHSPEAAHDAEEDHGDDTAAGDEHDHDEGTEDDHGHDHGGEDPHIWFDPTLVAPALEDVARAVVDATGVDEDAVLACAAEYRDRLSEVDAEIQELVAGLPADDRILVTNHDAFRYFAERYGFEVAATVIPTTSSLSETNPAALEDLAATLRSTGTPAVFTEVGQPAPEAEALAERVGDVSVVGLHTESLGPQGSGAETYLDMLRTNARLVVEALQGS